MARYKLLMGGHIGNDRNGKEVRYVPGDVIDTDQDLLLLNGTGMSPKFERLHDGPRDHHDRPTMSKIHEEAAKDQPIPAVHTVTDRGQGLTNDPRHPPPGKEPQPPAGARGTTLPSHSLHGHPPPRNEQEYEAALNKMSVKELQAHAAEEEVDIKGSTNKNEIIRLLKGVGSLPHQRLEGK